MSTNVKFCIIPGCKNKNRTTRVVCQSEECVKHYSNLSDANKVYITGYVKDPAYDFTVVRAHLATNVESSKAAASLEVAALADFATAQTQNILLTRMVALVPTFTAGTQCSRFYSKYKKSVLFSASDDGVACVLYQVLTRRPPTMRSSTTCLNSSSCLVRRKA